MTTLAPIALIDHFTRWGNKIHTLREMPSERVFFYIADRQPIGEEEIRKGLEELKALGAKVVEVYSRSCIFRECNRSNISSKAAFMRLVKEGAIAIIPEREKCDALWVFPDQHQKGDGYNCKDKEVFFNCNLKVLSSEYGERLKRELLEYAYLFDAGDKETEFKSFREMRISQVTKQTPAIKKEINKALEQLQRDFERIISAFEAQRKAKKGSEVTAAHEGLVAIIIENQKKLLAFLAEFHQIHQEFYEAKPLDEYAQDEKAEILRAKLNQLKEKREQLENFLKENLDSFLNHLFPTLPSEAREFCVDVIKAHQSHLRDLLKLSSDLKIYVKAAIHRCFKTIILMDEKNEWNEESKEHHFHEWNRMRGNIHRVLRLMIEKQREFFFLQYPLMAIDNNYRQYGIDLEEYQKKGQAVAIHSSKPAKKELFPKMPSFSTFEVSGSDDLFKHMIITTLGVDELSWTEKCYYIFSEASFKGDNGFVLEECNHQTVPSRKRFRELIDQGLIVIKKPRVLMTCLQESGQMPYTFATLYASRRFAKVAVRNITKSQLAEECLPLAHLFDVKEDGSLESKESKESKGDSKSN